MIAVRVGGNPDEMNATRTSHLVHLARPSARKPSQSLLIDTAFTLTERGMGLFVPAPDNKPPIFGQQPWNDEDILAMSPNGRYFVRVQRLVPQEGETAKYTVTSRGEKGQLFSVSHSYKLVPLTDKFVSSWAADFVKNHENAKSFPSTGVAKQAVEKALFRPKFVPTIRQVILSNEGNVWLERNSGAPASAARSWDVLGPDGQHLASVSVPSTLTVLTINGDRIWGLENDEDGNPQLVRYAIKR